MNRLAVSVLGGGGAGRQNQDGRFPGTPGLTVPSSIKGLNLFNIRPATLALLKEAVYLGILNTLNLDD